MMEYKNFIIRRKKRLGKTLGYEWWKHGCTNQADIIEGTGDSLDSCKKQIDRVLHENRT